MREFWIILQYATKICFRKALAPNKPFASSGKGYQDALIWFSVVELAQSCDEEICFISANSHDWCQSKNDLQLSSDLLNDLNIQGIVSSRVRFFASLTEFVQQPTIGSPVPPPERGGPPFNYQQILTDSRGSVESMLTDELPTFLRNLSRADAPVEDLEVEASARRLTFNRFTLNPRRNVLSSDWASSLMPLLCAACATHSTRRWTTEARNREDAKPSGQTSPCRNTPLSPPAPR